MQLDVLGRNRPSAHEYLHNDIQFWMEHVALRRDYITSAYLTTRAGSSFDTLSRVAQSSVEVGSGQRSSSSQDLSLASISHAGVFGYCACTMS
jgi:hypothetical protein